ncbi:hypothetical protein TNCT_672031 [Trichonephila clavata]|uniref:Uncharacterized protein n=1 Tax=Trichonephila clavata TaxID=2740835 RepID=A0A8X6KTP5_TRICU|nr:hypothetical protein TNCT_672031 [Trichonephila clavata]
MQYLVLKNEVPRYPFNTRKEKKNHLHRVESAQFRMHHQNTYKRRDRAGIPVIRFISHKPSIPSMAANRIAIFQNPEPRLKRLSEKKKKKAIDPNTSLLTLLQGGCPMGQVEWVAAPTDTTFMHGLEWSPVSGCVYGPFGHGKTFSTSGSPEPAHLAGEC